MNLWKRYYNDSKYVGASEVLFNDEREPSPNLVQSKQIEKISFL